MDEFKIVRERRSGYVPCTRIRSSTDPYPRFNQHGCSGACTAGHRYAGKNDPDAGTVSCRLVLVGRPPCAIAAYSQQLRRQRAS